MSTPVVPNNGQSKINRGEVVAVFVERVVIGGNSQVIGSCCSGMGVNAHHICDGDNGDNDQSFNGEESLGPSNPQLDNTAQPLGCAHLAPLAEGFVVAIIVEHGASISRV